MILGRTHSIRYYVGYHVFYFSLFLSFHGIAGSCSVCFVGVVFSSVGWQESMGIMVSVYVGFLYTPLSIEKLSISL